LLDLPPNESGLLILMWNKADNTKINASWAIIVPTQSLANEGRYAWIKEAGHFLQQRDWKLAEVSSRAGYVDEVLDGH
jgi:hypothetical protein